MWIFFVLKDEAETFQGPMDVLLVRVKEHFALVYLNDVIVFLAKRHLNVFNMFDKVVALLYGTAGN